MARLIPKRKKKVGLPPGSLVYTGDKVKADIKLALLDYSETQCAENLDYPVDACGAIKDSPSVAWLNVDGVSNIELLKKLGDQFGLHPLVLEDILNTDQRPKIEDHGDYLFIVIKMLSSDGNGMTMEQVSLILGKNFVISFQEDGKPGDVFDPLRTRLRNGAGRIRRQGADFLAYSLLDAIVDNYFLILENVGTRTEVLEDELLLNPTPATVDKIQRLRREMVFLRKSVWPLREVVSFMQRAESPLIHSSTGIYLRDVYDHTIQVIDTIETLRDMISGMLDIYLSSISFRMNEIMKVLTIMSTVFIPLTFIVGVYGMNFEFLPELKWHWAYPALWVFMVGVVLVMLLLFRRKRWI